MLSTAPLWIIGRSNLPAKDLKELIAWLKANPDKASAATTGLGSGIHMCLVYFQNMTGTKFPLAPYRGAAPLMQDMVAGQIDLSLSRSRADAAAIPRRHHQGLCSV